jgi:3-dehydroquinate dehydratase
MESDPVQFFGMLLRVCIRDDWKKESMLTATTISFILGMGASVLTAYFLTVAHLLL